MESVKVTVVLSTFNQAPYVRQAIESILMQKTSFLFEILAADDSSTDGTQEIILEYEKQHPDLICHYFTPGNIGDCKKFTNCVDMGLLHGEYLAHLEGDDYWLRDDRLQILADFLDTHPTYSRVSHRTMIVDEDGNQKGYDLPLEECDCCFTTEDFLAGKQYSDVDSMYRNYYLEVGDRYHELICASLNMSDFQDMFITQDFGPVYILADCLSAYRSRSTVGKSNYNSIMTGEKRGIDFIRVAEAVERHYHGRYDLTPVIRSRQKIMLMDAVQIRDEAMLTRIRAYISKDELTELLPELWYRLLRAKDREGRVFLSKHLTAKEKFRLYAEMVPYCFWRWTHRSSGSSNIRGYVVQP